MNAIISLPVIRSIQRYKNTQIIYVRNDIFMYILHFWRIGQGGLNGYLTLFYQEI